MANEGCCHPPTRSDPRIFFPTIVTPTDEPADTRRRRRRSNLINSVFYLRTPELHPLSGNLEETNNRAPALPALRPVIFGKRAQSLDQLRAFSTSACYLRVPPTRGEILWFSTMFVHIVGEYHAIPRTFTGARRRKAADLYYGTIRAHKIVRPTCIQQIVLPLNACAASEM